jgi:hypothetical protein
LQVKTGVLQNSVYTCSNGVLAIAEVDVGGRGGLCVTGGDGSVTVFVGYGKVCTRVWHVTVSCLPVVDVA